MPCFSIFWWVTFGGIKLNTKRFLLGLVSHPVLLCISGICLQFTHSLNTMNAEVCSLGTRNALPYSSLYIWCMLAIYNTALTLRMLNLWNFLKAIPAWAVSLSYFFSWCFISYNLLPLVCYSPPPTTPFTICLLVYFGGWVVSEFSLHIYGLC